MAAKSITAANAVFMIGVTGLFPTPVQLQGFAADDVFDTDVIQSAETLMGVDGKLSGGFVYAPVIQGVTLQADSDSIAIFDEWWAAQQVQAEVLTAFGLVLLSNLGKKWTMNKGFLTGYKPIPDAKKLLQPQKFALTWERVVPAIS